MRRAMLALGIVLATTAGACLAPPPRSQQVVDAARELNMAARFGRMDLAVSRTHGGLRKAFLERRSEWGKEVRVVDVQLSGLEMKDENNAMLHVDVAWVRQRESVLRNTRLAQRWEDRGKGGWMLVREKRVAGDMGLLGDAVANETAEKAPSGDVHFPSKTIR